MTGKNKVFEEEAKFSVIEDDTSPTPKSVPAISPLFTLAQTIPSPTRHKFRDIVHKSWAARSWHWRTSYKVLPRAKKLIIWAIYLKGKFATLPYSPLCFPLGKLTYLRSKLMKWNSHLEARKLRAMRCATLAPPYHPQPEVPQSASRNCVTAWRSTIRKTSDRYIKDWLRNWAKKCGGASRHPWYDESDQ